MKKIGILLAIIFTQSCYSMSSAILSREVINLISKSSEDPKLLQACNILNTCICGIFLYTGFKCKAKREFLEATRGVPFAHIKMAIKLLASAPLATTGFLMLLMHTEDSQLLRQAGLTKDIFIINGGTALLALLNALSIDFYDYCYQANNKPLSVASKINFDQEVIDRHTCLICFDTLNDPINPCSNNDHLFCKSCLTEWFKHNESIAIKNDEIFLDFKCIACTKAISKKNGKVFINRLEYTPISTDFIKSLIGFKGIMIVLLTCNICYLVFLATT